MFIQNKYLIIYNNIINRARNRTIYEYTERHHIIPKSLNGSNDKDNIVKLTAREHFICHQLLIRIVCLENRHKMVFAAWQQSRSAKYRNVKIVSRTYEVLKKQLSRYYKGRKRGKVSETTLINMRAAAKTRKHAKMTEARLQILRDNAFKRRGTKLTIEHKQKCSIALKGKITSEETKEKIRLKKIGIKRPVEVIEKMKNTIKEKYPDGRHNGMKGKKHTYESITKMSKSKKGILNPKKWHPVICITTGESFPSVKSAAKAYNISSSYISCVLTGLQKSTKGLVFKYKVNP